MIEMLFKKYDKFKILKREITFKSSLNKTYIIKQKVRFLFFEFWQIMSHDGIPYEFCSIGAVNDFLCSYMNKENETKVVVRYKEIEKK